jgi:hypothetical protein
MIDPEHPELSIVRQCVLVSTSRPSVNLLDPTGRTPFTAEVTSGQAVCGRRRRTTGIQDSISAVRRASLVACRDSRYSVRALKLRREDWP